MNIQAQEVAGSMQEILSIARFIQHTLGSHMHVVVVISTHSHLLDCFIGRSQYQFL